MRTADFKRISGTVTSFVMHKSSILDMLTDIKILYDLIATLRMGLHKSILVLCELIGLSYDLIRNKELSYIMEKT